MDENIKISGILTLQEIRDGEVVQEVVTKNKIVNSGLNVIIKGLVGDLTSIDITHLGIGTGSTAVSASDTALDSQTLKTSITSASEKTNNEGSFTALIPDADLAAGSYREAGLFVSNTLFCRLVLTTVFTKSAGSDVLATYEVEVTG